MRTRSSPAAISKTSGSPNPPIPLSAADAKSTVRFLVADRRHNAVIEVSVGLEADQC